ncbi:MAG: MBL fold metallo-hydrolase [Halobacteriales archaeon]
MELVSGVHAVSQTVEQDGVENTIHPAAVETSKGIVLLDVGFPGATDQIAAGLEDMGNGWDDVRSVVLTHQDGDHAGALQTVVERTDATVYAHEICSPYIDGRKHPIKSPEGQRYPPVDVDVDIVGGVSFRTAAGPMEVIYTPGHAPGHVSLYFPDERLLIAADALTADEDGLAGPSEEYTLEMDEALDSAAALGEFAIEQILCYHGGVVAADGEAIRELVATLR